MAVLRTEQFEHDKNRSSVGFLLSGDTTGGFAKVQSTSSPVISSLQPFTLKIFTFYDACQLHILDIT